MNADDLADACLFLMQNYESSDPINVGTGEDMTIRNFAELVARVTGFKGDIKFEPSKPDGTPVKCLNVSRIKKLGWHARIEIEQGIRETYEWYLTNKLDL